MITMRSLTITSNGADVFVIYVMEIDVNIVWPMDFSRCSFCKDYMDVLALPRFPFDTNHIEFKLSAFTFHDYKVGREVIFSYAGSSILYTGQLVTRQSLELP